MGEKETSLFESPLVDIANVLEFDLAGLCMKLFLLLGLCLMQILLTQKNKIIKKIKYSKLSNN